MLTRFANHLLAAAVAAAALLLLANCAEACPTCKNGIAGDPEQQQRVAAGYYYSILFMMSMPFLLLGSFGSYVYFTVRKAKAEQAEQSGADGTSD